MFKISIITLLLSVLLNAGSLTFIEGNINAHTEVFGDDTIDPFTTQITSHLILGADVTELSGDISILSASLMSANDGRDEHMHEALHFENEKFISVKLIKIEKNDLLYTLNAALTLNGVTKHIVSDCTIEEDIDNIILKGKFNIKMTDYNIQPPSMLFFTVRDEVNIKYNLHYRK